MPEVKRSRWITVDPYYGQGQARSGAGPIVYGVDWKGDTVWFQRRRDALLFLEWAREVDWDLTGSLEISLCKAQVPITGKIISH